jgi:hypothetical protein
MRIWMWAALAAVVMTNLAPAADPWNLPQSRGGPPIGSGLLPARNAAWHQEAATPAPARSPAPMPAVVGNTGIGLGSSQGPVGNLEHSALLHRLRLRARKL